MIAWWSVSTCRHTMTRYEKYRPQEENWPGNFHVKAITAKKYYGESAWGQGVLYHVVTKRKEERHSCFLGIFNIRGINPSAAEDRPDAKAKRALPRLLEKRFFFVLLQLPCIIDNQWEIHMSYLTHSSKGELWERLCRCDAVSFSLLDISYHIEYLSRSNPPGVEEEEQSVCQPNVWIDARTLSRWAAQLLATLEEMANALDIIFVYVFSPLISKALMIFYNQTLKKRQWGIVSVVYV